MCSLLSSAGQPQLPGHSASFLCFRELCCQEENPYSAKQQQKKHSGSFTKSNQLQFLLLKSLSPTRLLFIKSLALLAPQSRCSFLNPAFLEDGNSLTSYPPSYPSRVTRGVELSQTGFP